MRAGLFLLACAARRSSHARYRSIRVRGIGIASARTVWVATSPLLEGKGDLYCENCDVAMRDNTRTPTETGVRDYAVDPAQAARLWNLSAELTGINAFA
ncbi:hypothetical protein [Burkholderia sp. Ac-20392]|uniref:hypothetical protein n=1 Tax=Burkholderia sp. Ac-20392 TaxID=2703905 RepID=UPI00197CD343|nr:hypothetical protein [Burkholderia sp. Ac-20392]